MIRDLDHLREIVADIETPLGTFRLGEDTPHPVGVSAIPKWDMTGAIPKWDMTGENERPPPYKGPFWLQFVLNAPDYAEGNPDPQEWRGRKWRISRHMTTREVVATAFQAVLSAQEHEVRETFKWCGLAVFGPHIPLSALMGAVLDHPPDARG